MRINGFMNITVSDNGCGISETDLPRVTEKNFIRVKCKITKWNRSFYM